MIYVYQNEEENWTSTPNMLAAVAVVRLFDKKRIRKYLLSIFKYFYCGGINF